MFTKIKNLVTKETKNKLFALKRDLDETDYYENFSEQNSLKFESKIKEHLKWVWDTVAIMQM